MADQEVDPRVAAELKRLEGTPMQKQEKIVATKGTGHSFTVPFYKKHKQVVYVAVAIFVVLILSIIFIRPSQYKKEYLTNNGVKFSFSFSRTPTNIKISGQNALLGWNLAKNNKLVVITNVSPFHLDCGNKASGLTTVFTTSIYSKKVSTCTDAKKYAYITTFEKNGKWYILQVSSNDLKTPVDVKTAHTIVSSVRVI